MSDDEYIEIDEGPPTLGGCALGILAVIVSWVFLLLGIYLFYELLKAITQST